MFTQFQSAIGMVRIDGGDEGLTGLSLLARDSEPQESPHPLLTEAKAQLLAYFAGERFDFDLPLADLGTPFQKEVWHALTEIPYGQTRTYAQIAERIGRPKATRAVGSTNGRNPWWIVVPCHRVIGSNGSLTGYAGGIEVKRWLLHHETWHNPHR